MTVLATIASFLLAGLIGFAAHRGGVCTVKAVAWVMVVSLPLVWLTGDLSPVASAFPATLWGLVGGFVFGIGAAAVDQARHPMAKAAYSIRPDQTKGVQA